MSLVTDRCADYYEEVRSEAEKLGLLDKFQEQLDYLSGFACSEDDKLKTRCTLFKDFSPLSFEFGMERRNREGEYEFWFNGGLFYFQGSESGANAPQLSVTLSGRSDARWEVHT